MNEKTTSFSDFYINGYRVVAVFGDTEIEDNIIYYSHDGIAMHLTPETHQISFLWKEGADFKTKNIHIRRRLEENQPWLVFLEEVAKEIIAQVREFIKTIEQFKYEPKHGNTERLEHA
jgi:hypothetical protein